MSARSTQPLPAGLVAFVSMLPDYFRIDSLCAMQLARLGPACATPGEAA